MSLPSLARRIDGLGAEVLACGLKCHGITRTPQGGRPPRGLYLEDGEGLDGVILCGLNPGNAPDPEMKDFRKAHRNNDLSYPYLRAYWESDLRQKRYFKLARAVIRALGFPGPILWTNVAKCEATRGSRIGFATHPETFRCCAGKHLVPEVEACPKSWPVIANGKDAFVAVSYLFPDRLVIGIPHSTGAPSPFSKLFSRPGVLRPQIRRKVLKYMETNPQGALWLGGETEVGKRGPGTQVP